MEMKTKNKNSTQKQTARELGCSDSTTKRYGTDINMKSPFSRIERRKENSHPSLQSSSNLKVGSVSSKIENSEFIEEHLDQVLQEQ